MDVVANTSRGLDVEWVAKRASEQLLQEETTHVAERVPHDNHPLLVLPAFHVT
jgi:hypothetical protein